MFLWYDFAPVRISELWKVRVVWTWCSGDSSVDGSVAAGGGNVGGCEFEGHVGRVACELGWAYVLLCAFPFAGTLIAAILQRPRVGGNEVRDE